MCVFTARNRHALTSCWVKFEQDLYSWSAPSILITLNIAQGYKLRRPCLGIMVLSPTPPAPFLQLCRRRFFQQSTVSQRSLVFHWIAHSMLFCCISTMYCVHTCTNRIERMCMQVVRSGTITGPSARGEMRRAHSGVCASSLGATLIVVLPYAVAIPAGVDAVFITHTPIGSPF